MLQYLFVSFIYLFIYFGKSSLNTKIFVCRGCIKCLYQDGSIVWCSCWSIPSHEIVLEVGMGSTRYYKKNYLFVTLIFSNLTKFWPWSTYNFWDIFKAHLILIFKDRTSLKKFANFTAKQANIARSSSFIAQPTGLKKIGHI